MAKIIKNGKYPEQNVLTCNECGCIFKYYDSEVNYESSTIDEEEFFGGFESHKWVECPQCGNDVIFAVHFMPTQPTWFDKLLNKIVNMFKRKNKGGK